MVQDKSEILEQMAGNLEPCMVQGNQSGMVMLTPKSVKPLLKIPITASRAELPLDIITGGNRSIYKSTWGTSGGGLTDLNVYLSTIKFPDVCPTAMVKTDHIEVVEMAIPKRTTRVQVSGHDQDKVNRINTAMTCDRYWMAIPFSYTHGAHDKRISIERSGGGGFMPGAISTKFIFSNRSYARAFAQLNGIEGGTWCSGGSKLMELIGNWGIFLSSGLVGGPLLFLIFVKNKPPDIISLSFRMIAILLALLIASIFLRIKAKAAKEAL